MMAALSQPNLLPIFDGGRHAYQLAHEWKVETSAGSFFLPAGLITDGASVPRVFWSFFPPDGLYRAATVLHDWLYAHRGILCKCCPAYSRRQSDALMLELSRLHRARGAGLMHAVVRMFGGRPWRRSTGPRIEPLRYAIS